MKAKEIRILNIATAVFAVTICLAAVAFITLLVVSAFCWPVAVWMANHFYWVLTLPLALIMCPWLAEALVDGGRVK